MTTIRAKDIFTWPNAISATGFALVLHGSAKADTGRGIAETVVGRLLDLLDGVVARRTGQTSEFGAGIDAAFDKAGVLAIGVNEWRKNIAPKPALLAIALQNAVNVAATTATKRISPDDVLGPTLFGKRAMGWQNGALGAYAVASLFRSRSPRTYWIARLTGDVGTIVGSGWFGIRASSQYVSKLLEVLRARQA